jgi:diguanylate cyclase (GGDEF)-like protein
MQGTYTPWIVYLSVALATVVSYTALGLSSRIGNSYGRTQTLWLAGGTFALGLGLWGIHFLALLAFELPFPLTYNLSTTVAALIVAFLAAAGVLVVVSRDELSTAQMILGAVVLTAGVCGVLYAGIASISVSPPIRYHGGLVGTALALAFVVSLSAIWTALRLRLDQSWAGRIVPLGAAVLLGSAVAGVQYIGLASAVFDPATQPLPGVTLQKGWVALAVGLFVSSVLALTLLTVVYDAYIARHVRDRDSAREQAHANARYAARHDALTNLPNRLAIAEVAESAIEEAYRDRDQFAVLVMNVNRLKTINESLGLSAGDELLRELAQRLRAVLRRSDQLARLAGDEFMILARHIKGQQDVEAIVAKINECLVEPFVTRALELHASLSIGISVFPHDGDTFEVLLRRADVAMRAAKDASTGGHRFYSEEMSDESDDRLALETELRRALELNQLELHYQPKVDIGTGRVRSAEALVRWRHPTRGLVPPNVFIPLAEDSGLIVPIGEWVLREACRQLRAWLDEGLPPVRVAVNLSAKQFKQADLPEVVRCALQTSNLQPGYLELELTESAVMDDAEKSAAMLQTLSTMGVHISIDDFGTGYSSLSHLRRFPLDKLKIDRSFIRDLMQNPEDVAIVRAIISLAHSLRLRVVAEGVETSEQLEFLRRLGCDQYQGFLYSPAVPAPVFAQLIKRLQAERTEYTEADMLKTQSRLSAYTPT